MLFYDALVLPSDFGETWGLVVNEALASGLPCLVSAACGCAEDLCAEATFGLGDVSTLASKILDMSQHVCERVGPPAISESVASIVRAYGESQAPVDPGIESFIGVQCQCDLMTTEPISVYDSGIGQMGTHAEDAAPHGLLMVSFSLQRGKDRPQRPLVRNRLRSFAIWPVNTVPHVTVTGVDPSSSAIKDREEMGSSMRELRAVLCRQYVASCSLSKPFGRHLSFFGYELDA